MHELTNRTTWTAGLFPGFDPQGHRGITLVVKCSHALDSTGRLRALLPSEPLVLTDTRDIPHPGLELCRPSEIVPFKAQAEFLLHGSPGRGRGLDITLWRDGHRLWGKHFRERTQAITLRPGKDAAGLPSHRARLLKGLNPAPDRIHSPPIQGTLPLHCHQAAPPDQRLPGPFTGGERLQLKARGARRDERHLNLILPSTDPVQAWAIGNGQRERLHLTCDTLILDLVTRRVHRLFRACLPQGRTDNAGWIIVRHRDEQDNIVPGDNDP
ncbi:MULTISPECIES: DUF2169 domain-containing protein [unclassified Ectothiorhodospira]|uniref:DUF2169 domain-containing protein n=1 Tax=unclassified Ectothiorhodospira TaxID=2684909 RepID=UPI001EE84B0E|nr:MULTISPECIES: DUF2169 domain-containing protein [unclassified Ectothiorhodospira]MCG5515921.1 DUF2169 domain-containing protein [Ectothiorhodospira sp. 9100]MCG5518476.1 DUF2169 domain-containing protein [Ectothiorhodospira sp. 9905]